jgi:hypothetical protein
MKNFLNAFHASSFDKINLIKSYGYKKIRRVLV